MKPHRAGIIALLTTVTGLSVALAHVVPLQYAAYVIGAGACAQAITKGIQMGATDVVPKDRSGETP